MLWPLRVDRAAVINAEGTRFAWANLMSAHLDLQPAVAASRTCAAASSLTLLFHWLIIGLVHVGPGLADFELVRSKEANRCMQDTTAVRDQTQAPVDLSGNVSVSATLFPKYGPLTELTIGIMYTNLAEAYTHLFTRGGCDESRRHPVQEDIGARRHGSHE
jgi:hypothetical protein